MSRTVPFSAEEVLQALVRAHPARFDGGGCDQVYKLDIENEHPIKIVNVLVRRSCSCGQVETEGEKIRQARFDNGATSYPLWACRACYDYGRKKEILSHEPGGWD